VRLAGAFHLGDQGDAGRCTQDFWPSFGWVPLITLWMLLRCRQQQVADGQEQQGGEVCTKPVLS
jgi:hypothetical protein